LVKPGILKECLLALLGFRDGYARVPKGTPGSERVKVYKFVMVYGQWKYFLLYGCVKYIALLVTIKPFE
jgi:hypothetical protein